MTTYSKLKKINKIKNQHTSVIHAGKLPTICVLGCGLCQLSQRGCLAESQELTIKTT